MASKLIAFLLLSSTLASAQTMGDILNSSRTIDWSKAGLPSALSGETFPNGESAPNPWTPPTRPACTTAQAGMTVPIASGTAFGTDGTVANTVLWAMKNCSAANPGGSYLQLASGSSYTISSFASMQFAPYVTLRGAGPMNTKITLSAKLQFGVSGGQGGGALSANPSKGDTSVTVTGAIGVAPVTGTLAWFNQCDTSLTGTVSLPFGTGQNTCSGTYTDNNGVYVCGSTSTNTCNALGLGGGTDGRALQHQFVKITSVSGTGPYTIGFTPGIQMPNWDIARTAALYWGTKSNYGYGIGIEDLTIEYSEGQDASIDGPAYACWLKGVRFIGHPAYVQVSAFGASYGARNLITNNYFVPMNPAIATAAVYAIQEGGDSDTLILNNIEEYSTLIEGGGGDSGVVVAYNYVINGSAGSTFASTGFQHTGGGGLTLVEGNQGDAWMDDDSWGTANLNTLFRNWLACGSLPITALSTTGMTIAIDAFHRFDNAVANVLGGSSQCNSYEANTDSAGAIFSVGGKGSDALTASSFLRWLNYDTVTNTVRKVSSEVPTTLTGNAAAFNNTVPSNTVTAPASFFMPSMGFHPNGGTGLSWWKVCNSGFNASTGTCSATTTPPFPAIGPDVTGGPNVNGYAYDIPAAVAYKTLPIDTSYQHPYTITGGTYSTSSVTCAPAPAPCEILTVSGLPGAGSRMMGPMQISGGSCATTGAGTSTGAEVWMTATTSTTITYSLASNPGTCNTGSVLWPDIRQFDQRVYMSDPTSWSGILSSNRAINWGNAGLPAVFPDGETASNPWTPPTRPACTFADTGGGTTVSAVPVPSGTSFATLANAMYNCSVAKPAGSYLQLGSGTFTLSSSFWFAQSAAGGPINNVTLRGNGPQNTTIAFSGSGPQFTFGVSASVNYGDISGSLAKDATSLTITGATGAPTTGSIAWLNQCDTGTIGCGVAHFTEGSTSVTRVSGTAFDVSWVGKHIATFAVSGTPTFFTVASVTNANTLTMNAVTPAGYGSNDRNFSVDLPADNGGVFICSLSTVCDLSSATASDEGAHKSQQQMVKITSVTNNGGGSYTVSLSPGLYLSNWSATNSAQLLWTGSTNFAIGDGVEDLTFSYPGTAYNNLVSTAFSYASWIKGVVFLGASQSQLHLSLNTAKNFLVANNYFFGMTPSAASGNMEQLAIASDSDNLIINNILTQGVMEWNGGNSGDVFAYNYQRDVSTTYYQSAEFQHGGNQGVPMLVLDEGNVSGSMAYDDTWISHVLNTSFRNWWSCGNAPYLISGQNSFGIQIGSYARFMNMIGNALGGEPKCAGYTGSTDNNELYFQGADTLAQSSAMMWGQYDAVNGAQRFQSSEVPTSLAGNAAPYVNSVPANHNLPASFFMNSMSAYPSGGTGLSWWKTCTNWTSFPTSCSASSTPPMPPIHPESTGGAYLSGHVDAIPAYIAYMNLPILASYQNSYSPHATSASSWSGGIETIHITGAPSGTNFMGGFQLSGANAACTTGATLPNGEILMTGSNNSNTSDTTISYALTSNPGVNCNATVKWPDVRQFDERVYQLDSGGGGTATSVSTGVTFVGVTYQ